MLSIDRILVPVDFSACSRQALEVAVDLARTCGAKLDILHVFEELAFPSFYGAGAIMIYGKIPNLEAETRKAMGQLAESVQNSDVYIATHIRKGHPADEIAAFASENDIDLIVISTHGLTGLRHVVLGSVAERIVREAPCPVFVVKTHGKPISTSSRDAEDNLEAIDSGALSPSPPLTGAGEPPHHIVQTV